MWRCAGHAAASTGMTPCGPAVRAPRAARPSGAAGPGPSRTACRSACPARSAAAHLRRSARPESAGRGVAGRTTRPGRCREFQVRAPRPGWPGSTTPVPSGLRRPAGRTGRGTTASCRRPCSAPPSACRTAGPQVRRSLSIPRRLRRPAATVREARPGAGARPLAPAEQRAKPPAATPPMCGASVRRSVPAAAGSKQEAPCPWGGPLLYRRAQSATPKAAHGRT